MPKENGVRVALVADRFYTARNVRFFNTMSNANAVLHSEGDIQVALHAGGAISVRRGQNEILFKGDYEVTWA